MADEINESVATRYYRHGEPFWRELIVRQEQSGMGVRRFCVANGVAPSTFHKRRAMLREDNAGSALASLSTPEAMSSRWLRCVMTRPMHRKLVAHCCHRRQRHARLRPTAASLPAAACASK